MALSIRSSILPIKLLTLCMTMYILFNINQANVSALEDINLNVIQPNKPELNVSIGLVDPVIAGKKQVISITVKDSLSDEALTGVTIKGNMTLQNKKIILGKGETNKKGFISYTIPISSEIQRSKATIFIDVLSTGYDSITEKRQYIIIAPTNLFSTLFNKIKLEDKIENKNIIPLELFVDVINKSNQIVDINKLTYQLFIDGKPVNEILNMSEDNGQNLIISPENKSSLSLPVHLKKSEIDDYTYEILSTKSSNLASYLDYKLNGTMNIDFDNTNINDLPYDDKAEYFMSKGRELPILSDSKY